MAKTRKRTTYPTKIAQMRFQATKTLVVMKTAIDEGKYQHAAKLANELIEHLHKLEMQSRKRRA